jgi:hypothetical protein
VFVEFVGENTPAFACREFSPAAARELAVAIGAEDCSAAVTLLHGQVVDRGRYINDIRIPPDTWSAVGDHAVVNGCAASWNSAFTDAPPGPPGPLPGRFELVRQFGQGWLITGYQPC